jgi:hypothetical protein
MFRGSVKSTGYPFHSPVSPSLPLPCVTVCHHISTGLCRWFHFFIICLWCGVRLHSVPLWPQMDRMTIRWILDGRMFWNCGGMILIGENLSKCHWSHHKPTWTALESNTVLCGEKTGFLLLLSIHLCIYLSLFLQNFLLRRISIIVCIPIWTKKCLQWQHRNYTIHHQGVLKTRWCILRLCL